MNSTHLLLVVLIGGVAFMLLQKDDEWTGVVYPDRSNLTVHEFVGKFESLESCRETIIQRVDRLSNPNGADWECGLNCKPDKLVPEMIVCEKTER